MKYCRDCHKEIESGSLCPQCKEKNLKRIQSLRQYRKENNLCHQCGKELIFRDSRCQICYEKNKEYRKNRYDRLRDAGKCIYCGNVAADKPSGGKYTMCNDCWEKEKFRRIQKGLPIFWKRKQ